MSESDPQAKENSAAVEKKDRMTPAVESEIMDRTAALDRVGGDGVLLSEIAGLFLEEYPTQLEAIRAAVARHDATGLERAAHGLKGSVANFGARAVFEDALTLEQIGRARDLSRASELLNVLELDLEVLRPILERLAAETAG